MEENQRQSALLGLRWCQSWSANQALEHVSEEWRATSCGQTSEYSTKKPADLNIIHCRVDMLHPLPFTDPSVNTTLQHPL